jgi:hypothetical protein
VHACKRVAVAPRIALVRRAVAALRARYPELRQGVTLEQLERVADADGIRIHRVAMPPNQHGRALEFCGARAVLLEQSLAGDTALQVLAHEIAHLELHLGDRALGEARAAATGSARWALEDVVEAEADLYARALLGNDGAGLERSTNADSPAVGRACARSTRSLT